MKRIAVVAALIFLATAAPGQQIIRYVEQESSFPDLAQGQIHQAPNRNDVIIELNAEPILRRASKSRDLGASELDALFERLEKDIGAIGELSVASRVDRVRPTIRHRYTLAFAGAAATVSSETIESIRRLSYVRAVHPDRAVTALLTGSVEQIGAPQVWRDHGNRGAGAVVSIIDSGIDYEHPALGGGIGPGYKVLGGRDFVNGDDDPMDDAGHGTHVAGIVAANGGEILGVAPEASLLAFKVLDSTGSGRDSWVLAAIEASVQKGADIVNMSLGRPAVPDDPVIKAVETAFFSGGVLFCVAAGNSGRFIDIGSPGRAPNAITVGAIDGEGRLASFSSKGPVVPMASIKPEIVAPGVGIISTIPGGGTAAYSGTSMAAPHVAGVAALVVSSHPEWTPRRVRTALISGARPTDAEVMAGGAGHVFAPEAVTADLFPSPSELSFGISNAGTTPPPSRDLYFTNRSSRPMTVTLEVEGLREGIELRASPAELEIAPDEAKRFSLELIIDHALLPAPEEGSLSFGGLIRVTGGGGSVSVPWSVTKASSLRVTWTGGDDAVVTIATEKMTTGGWVSRDSPSTDVIIGAGPVSLWLYSGAFSSVSRHVFIDDLDLSETRELSITPEDAPHRVSFMGRDASGGLLADRSSLRLREIRFIHPHMSHTPFGGMTFLDDRQEVFVSDLSDRVRLMAFERVFDIDSSTSWTVAYPPVAGVGSDLDLTIDTDAWIELPIRGVAPDGLVDPYQWVLSMIWMKEDHGMMTAIAAPVIEKDGSRPGLAATAWLLPSSSPDTGTGVIVEIGDWVDVGGQFAPSATPDIRAEFTGVDGGVVPGRSRAPGLADQVTPSGDRIVLGEAPGLPVMFLGTFDSYTTSNVRWFGPLREQRSYDLKFTRASLSDEDGRVIAEQEPPESGQPHQFVMTAALPEPGLYRLELSADSFEVAGFPAAGTLTSTFDTRGDDTSPPLLTTLRFEDGNGRTTAALPRGSASIVSFSAIDLERFSLGDLAREKTAVAYRRHSDHEYSAEPWIHINAVEVDDDITDPVGVFGRADGVLYRVDLGEVTSALTGPVDLRISLEDPHGNTTIYTLEPALVVRPGRRPGVSRP